MPFRFFLFKIIIFLDKKIQENKFSVYFDWSEIEVKIEDVFFMYIMIFLLTFVKNFFFT